MAEVREKPEHRASYQPDEDAIILAIVEEAKKEGLILKTAYIKAASELGRPVGSVSNRYRRLTSDEEKPSKELSEGERLALKIKSLSRDRERSAEKTGMYKEKFDALQAEHDELRRNYRALEIEYTKLVKTVKEVLGEE